MLDEELAKRLQQGDQKALVMLVERHHSPLIGYLYRLTGADRSLAEDLAQEVFVRLIRSVRLYQYPRPFKAWLYQIATNLARDNFKRAENRYVVPFTIDDTLSMNEPQPEEVITDNDETQRVIRAFHRLHYYQREVIVMRYFQELSLAEIADALDIPVGTVKSRLSLALKRIRELLEEESNGIPG